MTNHAKAAASPSAFLFFFLYAIAEHLGKFILGRQSHIPFGDWFGWDVPSDVSFARELLNGHLSFIYSNILCGIDGTLNGQSVDLMQLPYLFVPIWAVASVQAITISFIASLSMFVLLRGPLGFNVIPAVLGALLFSVLSPVVPFIGLGLAAAPIVAILASQAVHSGITLRLLATTIATGVIVSLASGFTWTLPYVLPPLFLWAALTWRRISSPAIIFAAFFAAGALARLPVLLEMAELGRDSHRTAFDLGLRVGDAWDAYKSALHWWTYDLRLLFWVPVVWLIGLRRDRTVGLALLCFFSVLFLAPLWDSARIVFSDKLGNLVGLNFYFHRILPFFAALATAGLVQGFHGRIVKRSKLRGSWNSAVLITATGISLLLLSMAITSKQRAFTDWTALGPSGAYLSAPGIAGLQFHPLDPYRVATVQQTSDPELANLPAIYGLEAADGYTSAYPMRYRRFWRQVIQPVLELDRTQRIGFDGWGNRALLRVPDSAPPGAAEFERYFRLNLLSLVGVRQIISTRELSSSFLALESAPMGEAETVLRTGLDHIGLSTHEPRFWIYRNDAAMPRFRLVGAVRAYDDKNQLLNALASATLLELRDNAFIERKDETLIQGVSPGSSSLVVNEYQSDGFRIATQSTSAKILFASINFQKPWVCEVDGKAVETLPVDHAFIGVPVPGGNHVVACTYRPLARRLLWLN